MNKCIVALSLLVSCSAFAAPTETCESAYLAASASPSISDVDVAGDLCQKAADDVCDKSVDNVRANSGSYRDVESARQSCALRKAYGANKALNGGQASSSCEQANNQAMVSILNFGAEASSVCDKESDVLCNQPTDTGDGRLLIAICQLKAARGAYLEVSGGR